MRLLGKGIINREIIPHLRVNKHNRLSKEYGMWRVVECIVYKLKTGVQWHLLPMRLFFKNKSIHWQSVYYHYNRWSADGSWECVWHQVMSKYKDCLDLSSVDLDGTHSPCKKGGEEVGYQGRKKAKTTNLHFLTDRKGNVLGCSQPISGDHHDTFEIEKTMAKILNDLHAKNLNTVGLFLNADPGFDCKSLRTICFQHDIFPNIKENKRNKKSSESESYPFDNELYKERYAIERTNAWVDNFRQLIIRYETKARNWMGAHYLAFTIMFLKKNKIVNTYF